jgi:two-component system sensor histidine kinase DegS
VYQEQMNNIFKHSACQHVEIILMIEPDEVVLEIKDDGIGFALPDNWIKLVRGGHLGLVGMRERIEAVDGKMEIQSRPGEGTTIRVSVPVVKENQPA